MLHTVFLWLTYFTTGGLYLLIPFTYFSSQLTSPLATTGLLSVSVSLFSLCCICLFVLFYKFHK